MSRAASPVIDAPRAGLVVARHRRDFLVDDLDGERHRCLAGRRDVRPVVGDRVEFVAARPGESGRIERVAERDNCLERIDSRGRSEALAANLTQLLVIVAPEPPPDLLVVDRYLCAARLLGLRSSLVLNKCDLASVEQVRAGLQREYESIGCAVLSASAAEGHGLAAIEAALAGQVTSFMGQSGVGKSSLINRLVPAANQSVGEVSDKSGEGRHTTTTAVAHRLANGGLVVDFPGVRGYSPPLPEPALMQSGFAEIAALAGDCRFANCLHVEEPGCAVKHAIAAGTISARRYASYRQLLLMAQRLATPRAGRRRD
jgi:ribosome biogenesis GTPase